MSVSDQVHLVLGTPVSCMALLLLLGLHWWWTVGSLLEGSVTLVEQTHSCENLMYLTNYCDCWVLLSCCLILYYTSRFSHVQLCATLWTAAHQALCLRDSPGKNTGVGCHFLLQALYLVNTLLSSSWIFDSSDQIWHPQITAFLCIHVWVPEVIYKIKSSGLGPNQLPVHWLHTSCQTEPCPYILHVHTLKL